MNSQILKPLAKFVKNAGSGTYICDFQFNRINYASKDIACTIRARVHASATTYIIDVKDEDKIMCDKGQG